MQTTMTEYIVVCVLSAILVYVVGKVIALFLKCKMWYDVGRNIPGPPTHWFWGNLHQVIFYKENRTGQNTELVLVCRYLHRMKALKYTKTIVL